jgi:myo-inositol-1(or 4)-monophosphatase
VEGAEDSRLSLALRLAEEAGRAAMAGQPTAVARWKGPGDRVTEVDLQIQAGLTGALARAFPADGIVAEEGEVRRLADHEFAWIVDPLDGTNNYALGIPCFAISVGLLRRGEPYAGVVHEPNTGFRCWALRGRGAFTDARRLALVPRALDAASNIAVRVPVDATLEPLVGRWLREHKFRGFGSVALHLAFAALGAVDLVLDHRATLWDLAAGAAVLLEAGGSITTPEGRPLFPFDVAGYEGQPVRFLAGNPRAHADAAADCRAALAERAAARPR